MKRLLSLYLLLILFISCKEDKPATITKIQPRASNGQDQRPSSANMDKSPMDISYFPDDFPVLKMSGKIKGMPVARIIYSRPSKDGREIFGNVVKFGKYWRLGANEGTELEFFRDVIIQDEKVKKGRYIIYCVPNKQNWTIKLNSDLFTWGLSIHSSLDVYSFDIPVQVSEKSYELLTMTFEPVDNGGQLMIAWDTIRTFLPFTY